MMDHEALATNDEPEYRRLASEIRLRAIRTPDEGLSREQMDRKLVALGHENQQNFARSIAQLRADMRSTNPVHLLAILAVSSMFHPENYDPELQETQPHLQLHFELIQALALMHPTDQYASALVTNPQRVQDVLDQIQNLTAAYALKGLAVPTLPTTDEERTRLTSQAAVRAHTVAVRNLGYLDQLKRLAIDLVAPLDNDCATTTGLRLTDLLQFIWNIIELIESRYNADMRKMASVFAATTIEAAVHAYYAEYPEVDGAPAALIAIFHGNGSSLERAKLMLLYHRELSFPGYFILTADDLVSCYPRVVPIDQILRAMALWSMTFGDLSGRDPEHFFLDNPIWNQPFIRLDDKSYFCPVPGVLWSFHLRLVEEFIFSQTTLKARYQKRRDKFLESQVEGLFRQAFPSAQVHAGSKWADPETGRNGENDLLIILDDIAFVIEDKAGNVSDEALRALPDRLTRTLRDLVVHPAEQSRNFIALLQRDPGPHTFAVDKHRVNVVDASGIRRFVPISITWETFGAFRLRSPLLADAGLVPDDHQPTATMSLAELETVLETLDSEGRRAHYLIRRSELENNGRIVGDEIDLLGFYLNEGFGVASLRREDVGLVDLTMQSKHVDQHILRPHDQPPTYHDGIRLTSLWEQLVADLDQRRPKGWLRATVLLLNVPYKRQTEVTKRLQLAIGKTKKAGSARKVARERQNLKTAGLALESLATRGFSWDELHESAQASTNLDGTPPVLTICVRMEESGAPFVGL